MSDENEVILVMPRAAFRRHFGVSFLYRPLPENPHAASHLIQNMLACCVLEPRTDALEADPAFKQVVAYTVLTRPGQAGTEFWAYRRPAKDGDSRLRGKVSLGVGGHVCDADSYGHAGVLYPGMLLNAAERELAEEVGPGSHAWTFTLRGFVNDESNDVGRCHLGFVFTAELSWGEEPGLLDGLEPMGWYTAPDLYRLADAGERFETWSLHLLGAVHGWEHHPGHARFA